LAQAHWSSANNHLQHQNKKTKLEIVGRERSLLLGLLQHVETLRPNIQYFFTIKNVKKFTIAFMTSDL
jgi:hypothetical protein